MGPKQSLPWGHCLYIVGFFASFLSNTPTHYNHHYMITIANDNSLTANTTRSNSNSVLPTPLLPCSRSRYLWTNIRRLLCVPLIYIPLLELLLPASNAGALLPVDLQDLVLLQPLPFAGLDMLPLQTNPLPQLPHNLCHSLYVPFGRLKRSANLSSSGVKVFLGPGFLPIFLEKPQMHAANAMNAIKSPFYNRVSD